MTEDQAQAAEGREMTPEELEHETRFREALSTLSGSHTPDEYVIVTKTKSGGGGHVFVSGGDANLMYILNSIIFEMSANRFNAVQQQRAMAAAQAKSPILTPND